MVKAYGEAREYRGNLGYSDELGSRYCYDSFVPNCRQVDVGHVLLIRGKSGLQGVARVRDIDSWEDTKDRLTCPECRRPTIKYRKTLRRHACQNQVCRATFQQPVPETVPCTCFDAAYEGAVVLFEEAVPVTPAMIREASPRYNRQNAIVPLDLARLGGAAWASVRQALARLLQETEPPPAAHRPAGEARTGQPADPSPVGAEEGRILSRRHRRRERNPRLVERKKALVMEQKDGRLICEACDLDFVERYGEALGAGLAECHHRTPLGLLEGRTFTRLEDLAIVCANCHRVLHRRRGKNLTVEQLRELVEARRRAADAASNLS
jgi:hypothetical protein